MIEQNVRNGFRILRIPALVQQPKMLVQRPRSFGSALCKEPPSFSVDQIGLGVVAGRGTACDLVG